MRHSLSSERLYRIQPPPCTSRIVQHRVVDLQIAAANIIGRVSDRRNNEASSRYDFSHYAETWVVWECLAHASLMSSLQPHIADLSRIPF